MDEYGRLDLLQEVTTKDGKPAKEIIIYRPTCKSMMEIYDAFTNKLQVERFVGTCVRALNGGTEPIEFNAAELDSADGSELAGVITEMVREADTVHLPPDIGDGISAPLVYTLRYPIRLTPRPDAEVLTQLSFEARRIRELSEFLDAGVRGEAAQFRAFMRAFGTPLGIAVPVMSDILIDSLDFVDYLVIRGPAIMGKFTTARGRWKKTSSPSH
jgi:hypothetical protein